MAEGPLFIILEMIQLLLDNVLNTMLSLFGLLAELLGSLLVVIGVGGALGMFLAVIILAVVGFFMAKFFFGSMKTVVLLVVAGFLIIAFLLWGFSTL